MDFELATETTDLANAVTDWAKAHKWRDRAPALGPGAADWDDPAGQWAAVSAIAWREFVSLGVLDVQASGGTFLDTVAALMAVGAAGMPGPILEAQLAVATGNTDAASVAAAGGVVTSARMAGERVLVGWGAVADLVVDQDTGETVATAALPLARMSYRGFPHGWLERGTRQRPADGKRLGSLEASARRWTAAAALIVGLAEEAIRRSTEYASQRVQFGRPIGAFQPVQWYLVECDVWLRAARMAVYDAAWRIAGCRDYHVPAAAFAWMAASRLGRTVEANCHQVFGATGFTYETGLIGVTWPLWWIRASVGTHEARTYLTDARCRPAGAMASRVFDNYPRGNPYETPSGAGVTDGR
jgi:hypothetical protein